MVVKEVQFYFWEIYGRGGGKLLPVGGKRARVLFVDLRRSCRAGGPKLHIPEGIWRQNWRPFATKTGTWNVWFQLLSTFEWISWKVDKELSKCWLCEASASHVVYMKVEEFPNWGVNRCFARMLHWMKRRRATDVRDVVNQNTTRPAHSLVMLCTGRL